MFKTIKAQITAYKWLIIVSLIGFLALGLGWQYHRASMLENTVNTVKTKNDQLQIDIQTTTRQFNEYRENTDKALADLDVLRDSIEAISGQTAELQGKVNTLKRTPVAPSGANAKQLEDQANAITREAFNRIQEASRGKTK